MILKSWSLFSKKSLIILVFVLVNLVNFWMYKVFGQSVFLGAVLSLFSLFFLMIFLGLISKKWIFLGLILFEFFSLFIIGANFNRQLFEVSPLDKNAMTIRQSYFRFKVGWVVENRATLFLYKYEENVFTNLSFNQFFFGGAPRFRSYALDFPKFPVFLLPFFLYGLYWLILSPSLNKTVWLFGLIVVLELGFLNNNYNLGPLPLYPIISAVIAFGLISFFERLRMVKNVK